MDPLSKLNATERWVYELLYQGTLKLDKTPVIRTDRDFKIFLAVAVAAVLNQPPHISANERLAASVVGETLPSEEEIEDERKKWYDNYNEVLNLLVRQFYFKIGRGQTKKSVRSRRQWNSNIISLAHQCNSLATNKAQKPY